MRLKDKVSLVTGAGGGLGTAIAKRFAAEGVSVLCTDQNINVAEETVATIIDGGGQASALAADVAKSADCEAQVRESIARYGRIDNAVNNAGVAFHRLALDMTLDDWERAMRINPSRAHS
jgi:2-hydroxycyclohexanecarboxyl-CoA dehydrogenase